MPTTPLPEDERWRAAWNAAIEAARADIAKLVDRDWKECRRMKRAGNPTESRRLFVKYCGLKDALEAVSALTKEPADAQS